MLNSQFPISPIIGKNSTYKSMKYLIWNFDRGWWWKPNQRGYTPSRREAGQYDLETALDICDRANTVDLREAMVPINGYLKSLDDKEVI